MTLPTRNERLAALIRRMDDGMGIVKDMPDNADRYAHFADGSHGRNVYTTETPEPDPLYDGWKRVLTWDLDEHYVVWPEESA